MGDADRAAYEDALAEWETVEETQHLKINSVGDSNLDTLASRYSNLIGRNSGLGNIPPLSELALEEMQNVEFERYIDIKDITAPVLDKLTDFNCFQQLLRYLQKCFAVL